MGRLVKAIQGGGWTGQRVAPYFGLEGPCRPLLRLTAGWSSATIEWTGSINDCLMHDVVACCACISMIYINAQAIYMIAVHVLNN